MGELYDIVIFAGTGIILVSLVMALLVSRRAANYLKYFYFYPFIALFFSINTIDQRYFHLYTKPSLYFIQNLLFLSEFIFWTYFSFVLLKHNTAKKYITIISFIIYPVILLLIFISPNKPVFQAIAITNLVKCIFCLLYFFALFKHTSKLDLKYEPSFWIVTGVLFSSAINLPVYAIYNYLQKNLTPAISNSLFAATNISIAIMYLLFIKACFCQLSINKKSIHEENNRK